MYGNRVLILIPHPDDEVVGCCAAVRRARAADGAVFGFYLTNGVPARETAWPWQRRTHRDRVRRRWDEARRAADLLGISVIECQDIPTRKLKEHLAHTLARLEAVVAEIEPFVLWTPAYEGGHQDHDVANFLASRFRKRLPVWEFSEYNYAGGRVRSQEFPSPTPSGQVLKLTTAEAGFKAKALRNYRSERRNLGHVRLDHEAFRALPAHDYARPPHSGRLFYQRFQWVPGHPRIDYCKPQDVCRAIGAFIDRTGHAAAVPNTALS